MRVGFIGLGAMGSHMARNLSRAGLLCGLWNRTAEKSRALAAELGTTAAESPEALARGATQVDDDDEVVATLEALLPQTERPG